MDNVVQHIRIEDIVPRDHHYNLVDIKSLEDLAISIRENGVKEPLKLKRSKDKYEIISGNKRYRAAILAGLSKVPAIVEENDYNNLLKYITENDDNNYPKSINNNSDVVNLAELSQEYERDDFNMNNELINNNVTQQSATTPVNAPTFGGRFFPSLEDEPTNMAFNSTIEPPKTPTTPSTNNYIDLTDMNIQSSTPIVSEQSQNVNPVSSEIQSNIMQQTNVENGIMQPNNRSVLNIESLTQNSNMVQPNSEQSTIQQPVLEVPITNIDNNFQELMSDFKPSPVPNMNVETPTETTIEQQPIGEPVIMEQVVSPINNAESVMNNQINIPQDIVPTPIDTPIANNIPENITVQQPEQIITQPMNNIPNIDNSLAQPVVDQQIMQQPEIVQPQPEMIVQTPEVVNQVLQKDITPVINTLKAVGVNLENFGYKIRITDEDLPTSYKITIEIEK